MTQGNLHRRRLLAAGSLLAGGAFMPLAALAQSGAVRFILPNATGSSIDAITRAAAPALGKALGTSVVVENQPGAGGIVGLQALARATADGGTLSMVSPNVVIFPSVVKSLPFDMPGDFTPIAVVGATPMVLVANPARMPATNARDFFALLKAKPNHYNFGSGGNGTILHLATELVMDAAGTQARHIPYKGVGPMVTDLLSGQIDFATSALSSVQSHIQSGTVRAIGALGPQRMTAFPEVPTLAEGSLGGFSAEGWFAVVGPKGLSASNVKKIHEALVLAFADPAVRDGMARQGNTINISTPEQAQAMFRSELRRYAALVKKVGLEPQ